MNTEEKLVRLLSDIVDEKVFNISCVEVLGELADYWEINSLHQSVHFVEAARWAAEVEIQPCRIALSTRSVSEWAFCSTPWGFISDNHLPMVLRRQMYKLITSTPGTYDRLQFVDSARAWEGYFYAYDDAKRYDLEDLERSKVLFGEGRKRFQGWLQPK